MEELRMRWMEELRDRSDVMSPDRRRWMENLFETINGTEWIDIEKARTMSGYLMALRDCGKNIGDLKLILEQIIQEIKHN